MSGSGFGIYKNGSGGGGGGSNDKVKVDGGDATADFLKSKIQSDYTISVTFDTSNPSYIQILSANVSRWDDNGVTQNYASGSINTLGGFANVGTTGSENTAIGVDVFNVGATLTKSVGVGNNIAKTLITAQQITAIGQGALAALATAGNEQVAVGSQSLNANTGNAGGAFTGDFNVSIGTDSLALLNGGYRNTVLGHNAGGVITTGARNILVGFEVGLSALTNITTGNDNILMGYQADSDGDENLIIGNDSTSQLGSSLANQNTIIGNNASVNASLQIAIGYNADIINGGSDVIIGVNTSSSGAAFPTFSTLNTHVGSAGTIVGFYNQSLGYSHTITGDDNNGIGNFHTVTGNDCVALGNSLTIGAAVAATQVYALGVDSASFVDYSFQASWNDGTTQFDDIRLVSQASPTVGEKSFINLKATLDINVAEGTTFSSGFLQCNRKFVQNEQQNEITGGATTYTPDFQEGNIVTVDLSDNGTINAPTNSGKGIYYFRVVQDAVGSRTVTWNAAYVWAGGSAPTLTTTANKVDIFMVVVASNVFYCSVIGQNY
tara:strand:- start:1267 stop:2916 length:1650 start_codon:yes stop_codon:yes gene_type:complete